MGVDVLILGVVILAILFALVFLVLRINRSNRESVREISVLFATQIKETSENYKESMDKMEQVVNQLSEIIMSISHKPTYDATIPPKKVEPQFASGFDAMRHHGLNPNSSEDIEKWEQYLNHEIEL